MKYHFKKGDKPWYCCIDPSAYSLIQIEILYRAHAYCRSYPGYKARFPDGTTDIVLDMYLYPSEEAGRAALIQGLRSQIHATKRHLQMHLEMAKGERRLLREMRAKLQELETA